MQRVTRRDPGPSSAVDAQHRPPQLSELPGTACRDLAVIERSSSAALALQYFNSPLPPNR
ncbi:MAG TPA: hypothetical protein VLW55_26580 [Burkholderiaceae bacterium]|nr:hypothetical protein [Burkholderiaceae bacterium]